LGRLGFRYENRFGVPQNYIAAADLYHRVAEQGDGFAQCSLASATISGLTIVAIAVLIGRQKGERSVPGYGITK
jgi:TPR repeat protein